MMYRKDFATRYSPQILLCKGDIVKYRRPRRVQMMGEEKKGGKIKRNDNYDRALCTKNSKNPPHNKQQQVKFWGLQLFKRLFLKLTATPSTHTAGPQLWGCFSSAVSFKGEISIWYQKSFLAQPQKSLTVVYSLQCSFKQFRVLCLNKKAAYLEILWTSWH